MSVLLLNANSMTIPLADQSVNCVVTSPPYYGLRDYGISGQIGLEETPEAYVDKLVQVFREVRRVLKDDGTVWLNLGDSYAGSGVNDGTKNPGISKAAARGDVAKRPNVKLTGLKPKDLIGIPWMVAFALRADGWYLRSDIIWHKRNPMPESVTDRPTKSHEYIFLLTKSAQYYYDAAAIHEAVYKNLQPDSLLNEQYTSRNKRDVWTIDEDEFMQFLQWKAEQAQNKLDVWDVTTKPYKDAHFATFPPDLIEPCILAGTSVKGECPKCGKAWKRVVDKTPPGRHESEPQTIGSGRGNGGDRSKHAAPSVSVTIGWEPQCDCWEYAPDLPIIDGVGFKQPLTPVPQVVLDPFHGSGTTGAVSVKNRRNYIGIELNPAYIELSQRRIEKIQPILFEVS